jgi:hypothetical protein
MAVYICRKDGYNLSAEVQQALEDQGGDVLTIDVLVEGRPEDPSYAESSFLDSHAVQARDDVVRVIVTCPKDDTLNVFMVRRGS